MCFASLNARTLHSSGGIAGQEPIADRAVERLTQYGVDAADCRVAVCAHRFGFSVAVVVVRLTRFRLCPQSQNERFDICWLQAIQTQGTKRLGLEVAATEVRV